ncbi:retinal guanylyl cyclase 2-like isoform X2 [Dermatophagoides farinae]|uniref:retinal guanylyl cyclase 2-like isoform X2 n=1 Tax=Dermatophagoides farinae TaxID=6954 RepID=UPI003F625D43
MGKWEYFYNGKQFRHLVRYLHGNPHVNISMLNGVLLIDNDKINMNNIYGAKNQNSNDDDDDEKQQKSSWNMMRNFSRKTLMKNQINLQRNYFVWQYHHKSLSDIIHDNNIKLSWPIKLSFINDIIQGMRYLHQCKFINGHGWLNSRNCSINEHWQVKIHNFCYHNLITNNRNNANNDDDNQQQRQRQQQMLLIANKEDFLFLWMSPELLRSSSSSSSSKSDNNVDVDFVNLRRNDVYSFAMIVYEITSQRIPFSDYFIDDDNNIEIILNLIKYGILYRNNQSNMISEQLRNESMPLRPRLCVHLMKKIKYQYLAKLIDCCSQENPVQRPDFEMIDNYFQNTLKNFRQNSFEMLINKLNKYRYLIDDRVRKRTEILMAENKKCNDLLYRMFPRSIVKSLKNGEYVKPEKYDSITILFSDIVGFTTIASYSEPHEIMAILNNLFVVFDKIVNKYDIYKVETIGDAYLAVSGLPNRNTNHAEQISMSALEFIDYTSHFKIDHMPNIPLRIRVGIHTGSVITGVIGLNNPRYCIFGDSVNIASRLESTSWLNFVFFPPTHIIHHYY